VGRKTGERKPRGRPRARKSAPAPTYEAPVEPSDTGELDAGLLDLGADAEDATDASVASIRDAVAALRGCAARARAMLKVKYDDRLASHLSWLTKNMVANLDALRKAEKEARNRAAEFTRDEEVELVKVWLEELDVRNRRELRSYIDEIDRGESLLS